jgi:hypothetical protein
VGSPATAPTIWGHIPNLRGFSYEPKAAGGPRHDVEQHSTRRPSTPEEGLVERRRRFSLSL